MKGTKEQGDADFQPGIFGVSPMGKASLFVLFVAFCDLNPDSEVGMGSARVPRADLGVAPKSVVPPLLWGGGKEK